MAKDSTTDSKVDGLQKISKILLCFQKLNPKISVNVYASFIWHTSTIGELW